MKTPIITTVIGLTLLAAPAAAQDNGGTSTGYDAVTSPASRPQQGMLPAGDRSESYDNTDPAMADPHLGPGDGDEGADGDDAAGASDGEAGAAGGEGAGAGGAGSGESGS